MSFTEQQMSDSFKHKVLNQQNDNDENQSNAKQTIQTPSKIYKDYQIQTSQHQLSYTQKQNIQKKETSTFKLVIIVLFSVFFFMLLIYLTVIYIKCGSCFHRQQQNKQVLKLKAQRKKNFSFKMRKNFRDGTPPINSDSDLYQFSRSIQDIIDSSSIKYQYPSQKSQWLGLKKIDYQRAIRLMQIVHNVNYDGQFVFDHSKFYMLPQVKFKAFQKLLYEEQIYYDKKYQINKYWANQIGICIYSPSYNTAESTRLYLRNLDSIFQQDYMNYHVVFVNDFSTDGTGQYAKKYMEVNNIPPQKYTIINNQKRQGGAANAFMVGNNHCKLGQIMIMLDGDDALIGRQVFSLLNAIYQKQKIALTYGQFLLVSRDQVSSGFSSQIPRYALQQGPFRNLKSFYTSHLKSMYVDVFRQIKKQDLQYQNGTFYDYAIDVTYMTPAVELVGTRARFVKQLIYQYRYNTGLNQPGSEQSRVERLVYLKPAKNKMQNMEFADNPKTVNYISD